MSKQKNKRGVSYYFRLEFSTLQGKITTGFCALGIFAILLMGLATWILYPAVERSQLIAHSIGPAQTQVALINQNLLILSRTQSADLLNLFSSKSLVSAKSIAKLSPFSAESIEAREIETLVRRLTSLTDKSTKLSTLTSANDSGSELVYDDIKELISDSQRINQSIGRSLDLEQNRLSTSVDNRKSNIFWILFVSTIISIGLGAIIGSYIVINVLKVIKMLKNKILELSEGKIIADIPASKNELNSIIKAINVLNHNLGNIQRFAQEVGAGNFDSDVQVFDGQNHLGIALGEMRNSLKSVATEEQHRTWAANGLANFSNLLRANTEDINSYSQGILNEIVRYLNVNQGALYIAEGEGDNLVLNRAAAYAYGRVKHGDQIIKPGQGLAGQVFLEKEPSILQEVPEGFTEITSGLGESTPRFLILYPLIFNDKVSGILELAAFKPLEQYKLDFIEKLSEGIASSLHNLENSNATNQLLNEAQEMANAMQMQEELLRQNSEELIATQEQLSRDIEELKADSEIFAAGFAENPLPMAILDGNGQIIRTNSTMVSLGISTGSNIDNWIDQEQVAMSAVSATSVICIINGQEFTARAGALDTSETAHILVLQQQYQGV